MLDIQSQQPRCETGLCEIEGLWQPDKAVEQSALGLVEQVVRPLDRRLEGAMAWASRVSPSADEPQRCETRENLLGAQCARSRRDQLDRERQSVEPPANLDDSKPIPIFVDVPACTTGTINDQFGCV